MKFDSTIYKKGVYDEALIYDAWLKNTNERDLFKNFLQKRIDKWATKSPLSVVEVGSGSGAAGIRVMEILRNAGIEYHYTGVEPSEDQIRSFQKKNREDLNVSFVTSSLQKFNPEKKFDIAFVVHFLYYVEDLVEALKKIDTFSEKVVIVHHGPHGINEIHKAFRKHVKKGPHIISTYDDIATALKEAGIPYSFDSFPSHVDITSIKEADNETGKKMIQFFLERTDLSNDVIEQVRNYFRAQPDIMTQEVGIFITNHD